MRFKRILAALWAVLAFTCSSWAGSPVWKISGSGTHLYLGGTIHTLAQADYPLPQAFDRAYQDSYTLVFETDLAAMESPEFTKKMMGQMVYPDNRTLKTMLTPGTYAALYRFAQKRGLAQGGLDHFKPGMVMVILTLTEIQRLGQAGNGVDQYFLEKAATDGRPTDFLEPPMAQVRFLAGIGIGNEEAIIRYIIKDVARLPGLLKTIKTTWRQGDLKGLYTATLAPMKKDFPKLYQSLMTDRNRSWLPRIKTLLKTPEAEFVLVGAGHLAGDQGLLALLKEAGFTVRNL